MTTGQDEQTTRTDYITDMIDDTRRLLEDIDMEHPRVGADAYAEESTTWDRMERPDTREVIDELRGYASAARELAQEVVEQMTWLIGEGEGDMLEDDGVTRRVIDRAQEVIDECDDWSKTTDEEWLTYCHVDKADLTEGEYGYHHEDGDRWWPEQDYDDDECDDPDRMASTQDDIIDAVKAMYSALRTLGADIAENY